MIVEFAGTPGAGKTTLSTALVALLEERGIAAADVVGAARDHVRRTRAGRLIAWATPAWLRDLLLWQAFWLLGVAHALRFGLERPTLVRRAVRSQLRPRLQFRTRVHVLYWFIHFCGRYRFLRATAADREVLVLDDGFVQRAVHLFASPFDEPDPTQITEYVDVIPPPDLLVVAVAGWEECERRVRERGVWRHARHLSPVRLSRYFEHAEQVVDIATGRARERAWNMLEIATEHPDPDGLNAPISHVLASMPARDASERSEGDGGRVA
jgi:RecA/RadA recombinase